jgi:hypothetical protein
MTMRRPQFTLKSLLWLTAVVAGLATVVGTPAVVWYGEHSVDNQVGRWVLERDAAPLGYQPPPGWHLDRHRLLRPDKPNDGSK